MPLTSRIKQSLPVLACRSSEEGFLRQLTSHAIMRVLWAFAPETVILRTVASQLTKAATQHDILALIVLSAASRSKP